jgi:hypothetical protein
MLRMQRMPWHPVQPMAARSGRFIQLVCAFWLTAAAPASAADLPNPPQGGSHPLSEKLHVRREPFSDGRFILERGDVVAFVGGADVEAAQHTGHLEALLAATYPGREVRFRNFGWEGDTVHAQPRDVGFPPLKEHLRRAGVSVIVLQFGRTEAMSGRSGLSVFVSDYQKLLDACTQQTPRLVLVTPPPFEKGSGLLPDLSSRNSDLVEYADAIRRIARQRNLPLVDVFADLGRASHREPRLTDNGLQLTPRGHAFVARAFARQLGFDERAGAPDENGVWPNDVFERLRQAIVAKNRLWFNYWRPQNWAFLGGDRTEQPSSRDHRNPNIRWFPLEMEEFVPLIEAKEREIAELARECPR